MKLFMDDVSTLTITGESSLGYISFYGLGNLCVYNFRGDSIFLSNDVTVKDAIKNRISLYNNDGEFIGMADVGTNGALIAVPEPSLFAAILGAFILAFVIAR